MLECFHPVSRKIWIASDRDGCRVLASFRISLAWPLLMPAALDSSVVPGFSAMPVCSHITNNYAIAFVRTCRNDFMPTHSYTRNMARRGVPNQINWYLREWMQYYGVNQTEMRARTDWSKATTSQLYNNIQDYSPKIINDAARALNIATYELLMKPETAMALRRLRLDALRVVEDSKPLDPPPEAEPKKRRAGGNSH